MDLARQPNMEEDVVKANENRALVCQSFIAFRLRDQIRWLGIRPRTLHAWPRLTFDLL